MHKVNKKLWAVAEKSCTVTAWLFQIMPYEADTCGGLLEDIALEMTEFYNACLESGHPQLE